MVLVIPIMLSLVLSAKERWLRTASGVAVGLAALAQLFTYTRAGWMASIIQQAVFWFYIGRRKVLLWIGVVAVLMVIGLGVLSYEGYQQGVTATHSLLERVAVWKIGILEVVSHPLVGVGYGDATFIKRFADRPEAGPAPNLHSTFLMIAMGAGVPGLALFLAIFVKTLWELVICYRKTDEFGFRAFVLGIAVMIVGFCLRNLFDHMFIGSLAYLFWILTAIGLASTIRGASTVSRAKILTDHSSGHE
jgi:putative inorganic carbon (hco3(-)) transporter